jgi:hypothetical protein
MKKFFVIVSTPFWMVNIDFTPAIDLHPVGNAKEIHQECHDFERAVAFEDDPGSFDFLRRQTPLFFKVGEIRPVQKPISLSADASELEIVELAPGAKTLSEKAAKLGLASAGCSLENRGDSTYLKVTGRDLACDLLGQRLEIRAKTQMKAGPSHENAVKLISRLHNLKKIILQARTFDDPRLAAAVLGYSLEQDDLKLAFDKLVSPATMELSENWEYIGGVPSIKYDIWKDAGTVEAFLKVPYQNESTLENLEQKIAVFNRVSAVDLTEAQKREYAELNLQRAGLLRKRIRQKLKGKYHAF